MTWEQLFKLLQDMVKVKHTSLREKVECIVDGISYEVDIVESLHTGKIRLIAAIVEDTEEEVDGEA